MVSQMDDAAAQTDLMIVDRNALLRFFDECAEGSQDNATSIVAIAGEELGLALLCDHFRKSGLEPRLLPEKCSTGKKRGSRLDGWVQTTDVLYQVEVKNWSAHSFGGTPLKPGLSADELSAFRKARWEEVWHDQQLVDAPAAKVLERMPPPMRNMTVEPLIVFWVAMHPDGLQDAFFRQPLQDAQFPVLNVFSMSNYLRRLPEDTLELPLPKTRERLRWLSDMFTEA